MAFAGILLLLIFGTFLAGPPADSNTVDAVYGVGKFFVDAVYGVGKFFQVMVVFAILDILLLYSNGLWGRSGTFAGECPYCGIPTKLMVDFATASAGKDCPKCQNRIMLKNGKFYQLDLSNRLDSRFAGISQGIGLVRGGIIVSCFLPIALVGSLFLGLLPIALVGSLFLGLFTFSLLGLFTPILLCLGVSLAMQTRGVWLCWQSPDRTENKQWVTATLWSGAIALALLTLQALLSQANWLNLLIEVAIFAGQMTFLTYLVRLSGFLQRPDLVQELRFLRLKSIEIAVGTGIIGLPFAMGYETQIFIIVGLTGFASLLRYLNALKLLKSHLDEAMTVSE